METMVCSAGELDDFLPRSEGLVAYLAGACMIRTMLKESKCGLDQRLLLLPLFLDSSHPFKIIGHLNLLLYLVYV